MEQYVKDQIKYGIRYMPAGIIAGVIKGKKAPDALELMKKAGGFMRGVCHPSNDREQILNANIRWIRIDIPFPFDGNGEVTQSYEEFKRKALFFKEKGINVMAVTPYPRSYIDAGIDPRCDEQGVVSVAKFLASDMQGVADAFQITNEMGLPQFTLPLNLQQAARFIGIQAMAMKDVKGNILVGYNSAGPQADLHIMMKPYLSFCDYVGIDIYIGCFNGVGGFLWMFDAMLSYIRGCTGKPVILQEFGYISGGEPKTLEQRREILSRYGAKSEQDARENIREFVSRLPERMKERVLALSPDVSHQGDFIFKSDFADHLYCELQKNTKIPGYEHTPDGQAKFFAEILPRLIAKPYVAGAFIYSYSDSKECYVCSQSDCPTETRWGLVDLNGNEKPSYYAVQKAFNI